jgi:hypothetical protein
MRVTNMFHVTSEASDDASPAGVMVSCEDGVMMVAPMLLLPSR